jgi:hypothetical protein
MEELKLQREEAKHRGNWPREESQERHAQLIELHRQEKEELKEQI